MTHTEGPEAAQPPAAPRKPKRRQKIVLTVFLIVVAALLALVWVATRDNGENAQVGNCVTESGSNSVKIVDCGAGNATLKVAARCRGQDADRGSGQRVHRLPGRRTGVLGGQGGPDRRRALPGEDRQGVTEADRAAARVAARPRQVAGTEGCRRASQE